LNSTFNSFILYYKEKSHDKIYIKKNKNIHKERKKICIYKINQKQKQKQKKTNDGCGVVFAEEKLAYK